MFQAGGGVGEREGIPDSWNACAQTRRDEKGWVCFRNHNKFSGTRTKDTKSIERRQQAGSDEI